MTGGHRGLLLSTQHGSELDGRNACGVAAVPRLRFAGGNASRGACTGSCLEELVLLHALRLGGPMWKNEVLLPCDAAITPPLDRFGDSLEQWAEGVLDLCGTGPLMVVGSSVGVLRPKRRSTCACEGGGDRALRGQGRSPPEPLVPDVALRMLSAAGWRRCVRRSTLARTGLTSCRSVKALRRHLRRIGRTPSPASSAAWPTSQRTANFMWSSVGSLCRP